MFNRRRFVLAGMVASGCLGLVLGWWLGQPPAAWMDFYQLRAFYAVEGREITTDGQYEVRRECATTDEARGIEPSGSSRVIWRYEAIATDGQIASYGPKPPAPSFDKGEHHYTGSIPLQRMISPDGWVVRILITCPGEEPETVTSPAARVEVRAR
jgi:hypothetical protein